MRDLAAPLFVVQQVLPGVAAVLGLRVKVGDLESSGRFRGGPAVEHFGALVPVIDAAVEIADDDGVLCEIEQIGLIADHDLVLLAVDGVADGALEEGGVDLALDEVVGGAGFHGLDVDVAVVLTGQENDGRLAAPGNGFLEEVESGFGAQAVVEQDHVVRAPGDGVEGEVVVGSPVEIELAVLEFRQHVPGQEVVVLVVLDEENMDGGGGVSHVRIRGGARPESGSM